MRVLIIHSSKYGSTRLLAEKIAEGCHACGIDPIIEEFSDPFNLLDYLTFLPKRPPAPERDIAIEGFDLIFAGFEIHNVSQSSKIDSFIKGKDFKGKKIALFCTYYINRKSIDRIVEDLRKRNASVHNSISLRRTGIGAFFGRGTLSENDYVRASAFAERTVNNLLGRRVSKESEKEQIKGYKK